MGRLRKHRERFLLDFEIAEHKLPEALAVLRRVSVPPDRKASKKDLVS
jgi:hypothetical protein